MAQCEVIVAVFPHSQITTWMSDYCVQRDREHSTEGPGGNI